MRRLLIAYLLPMLLCVLPFLAAALVLLCIPHKALGYFFDHFALMEGLIVGGGALLFFVQMILCWKALRWQGASFDEGSDRWLSNLAQAAEWFPMLGLIGTVAGIFEAFSASQAGTPIEPRVIAPAITATGSGLFMALINILPAWVVLLGRDLILLLSGVQPKPPGGSVMIQMPRRNVTRFFIPLIDVLILLFCIFLLMEFNSESKVGEQSVDVEEQSEAKKVLESELQRRTKELQKFEELRPLLTEVDKLREENERLRNASQRNLQENAYVRILDIDAKNGSLSFFDIARGQAIPIKDAQDAQALIERHTKEASGRQLYYYFMYPRTRTVYPLFGQEQDYQRWFKKAANSLVKVGA